jgi:catechol 2,3-dioxygenase-like lactoylglutathione lyase family enzyme
MESENADAEIRNNEWATMMDHLDARSVFFVKDAERALRFYTEALGFSLDWNHQEQGRAYVFQVSLLGFQLILNQTESPTEGKAGHGRVFIAIYDEQLEPFRRHLKEKRIKTTVVDWGNPTLVIRDVDENELFVWVPKGEIASFEVGSEASGEA